MRLELSECLVRNIQYLTLYLEIKRDITNKFRALTDGCLLIIVPGSHDGSRGETTSNYSIYYI